MGIKKKIIIIIITKYGKIKTNISEQDKTKQIEKLQRKNHRKHI